MKTPLKLTPTILRRCVRPHIKSLENGLGYEDIGDWNTAFGFWEQLSRDDKKVVDKVKDKLLQLIFRRRKELGR